MSQYLGDLPEDFADLNFKFVTKQFSTGIPFALVGGVVSIYKSNSVTEITAGITLTTPFDSRTGFANVNVDLSSDAAYAVNEYYEAVLTAGTVDGVSVVGTPLANFSIEITGGAIALLGTPANIDSGGATIADNLKKLADNNGGADFVASTDSQEAIANGVAAIPTTAMRGTDGVDTATMRGTDGANTTTPPTAVQNRQEMDANSSQLATLVAGVDVTKLGGSTDALDNLKATTLIIYESTVTGSPSTTSIVDSTLGAIFTTNNILNDTQIMFGPAGTANGSKKNITAYDSATNTITFDAVANAPTIGDTYVLV